MAKRISEAISSLPRCFMITSIYLCIKYPIQKNGYINLSRCNRPLSGNARKSKSEIMKAAVSFLNIFILTMASVKQIKTERRNQKRVNVSMKRDFKVPAGDGMIPA